MFAHIPAGMWTIILLICSNFFMVLAWYGHLKFPSITMWHVVLFSWAIAFFEYCFQVPANRIGYGHFNAAELKTIQEVISLSIFMVFSVMYLHEKLTWNYVVGFGLIVLAAFVIFHKW